MTESQKAFESMFPEYTKNEDTKKRDLNPSLVQRFLIWQAAEAYGRKVALEEAVDLANNWAMEHVIEDNAKLTVGDYIAKELIK